MKKKCRVELDQATDTNCHLTSPAPKYSTTANMEKIRN